MDPWVGVVEAVELVVVDTSFTELAVVDISSIELPVVDASSIELDGEVSGAVALDAISVDDATTGVTEDWSSLDNAGVMFDDVEVGVGGTEIDVDTTMELLLEDPTSELD